MASPWSNLKQTDPELYNSLFGLIPGEQAQANLELVGAQREPAARTMPQPQTQDPAAQLSVLSAALPEVAKGSGQKRGLEQSQIARGTEQQNKAIWADPEEMTRIAQSIGQIPEIAALREGEQANRDLLRMQIAASNPQVDLSPILSLVDAQTGSKLAAGYQRPESAEQLRDRVMAYALQRQKEKGDVAKTILEGVGKFKAGQDLQTYYNQILQKANVSNQDPALRAGAAMPVEARAFRDTQAKYNKDVTPFMKSQAFAHEIQQIVQNEGPGSALSKKALETMLARARGEVGNLAKHEQEGTVVPPDVSSTVDQLVESLETGLLTGRSKSEVLGIVDRYNKASKNAIEAYREKHAAEGAEAYKSLGLGKQDFLNALKGVSFTAPPAEKRVDAKVEGVKKNATSNVRSALEEEMKKRGLKN